MNADNGECGRLFVMWYRSPNAIPLRCNRAKDHGGNHRYTRGDDVSFEWSRREQDEYGERVAASEIEPLAPWERLQS